MYDWIEMIRYRFPDLGKWQALGLALMSMGIVRSQHSCLSKIAEHLLDMGKPDSVERRLQRWVSNERIDMGACWDAWIKWVVASFDDQRLVLLVDETKLGSHLGVMMVGLAYQTRCIPLIWCCYRPEAYPEAGQVGLIKTLLLQVKRNLPDRMRPLVQADRGIGTSPPMCASSGRVGNANRGVWSPMTRCCLAQATPCACGRRRASATSKVAAGSGSARGCGTPIMPTD